MDVADICARLNQRAAALAPQLLPNGRREGNIWRFSGLDDVKGGGSAWLYLSGANAGHWQDAGNCAAGQEKGDMLDLVEILECGGDKRRAVEWAKAELGIADDFRPGERPQATPEERAAKAEAARQRAAEQERQQEAERKRRAKKAKGLYLSAVDLAGSPAEFYLRGRGIDNPEGEPWPGSLRYHAEVFCGPLQRKTPAMVATIVNAAGEQIGVHRTFLQLDEGGAGWGKLQHADVNPKMVLGNMGGGFVPIAKGKSKKSMRAMPELEPVYVTEGIEDALCVRSMLPEARVICAIALGNIGAIVLPPAARKLVIVADRDTNPTAQDTLERAIARQQSRGLAVQLVLPPEGIKDVNDWMLAERRAA